MLWLAVALMESLGIWVKICADPGYAGTDGFVLVPQDRAVIATWIRAEGIWYAGKTTRVPDLGDFSEVAGHVTAHSVTDDATPAGSGCWPIISSWTGPGFRAGAPGSAASAAPG